LSYIVILIVLDASTLILIAKIDILDIFLSTVGRKVAVPEEVAKECCSVKKTLDALMIQKALDGSTIKVMRVRNRKLVAKLTLDFNLGKGEAEALAINQRAQLVGIDDKCAMNACKLLGIQFTTALGVLVRSCERGLIHRSSALAKLDALAVWGRYQGSIIEHARLNLEVQK